MLPALRGRTVGPTPEAHGICDTTRRVQLEGSKLSFINLRGSLMVHPGETLLPVMNQGRGWSNLWHCSLSGF